MGWWPGMPVGALGPGDERPSLGDDDQQSRPASDGERVQVLHAPSTPPAAEAHHPFPEQ
jgi:hypothetical protein